MQLGVPSLPFLLSTSLLVVVSKKKGVSLPMLWLCLPLASAPAPWLCLLPARRSPTQRAEQFPRSATLTPRPPRWTPPSRSALASPTHSPSPPTLAAAHPHAPPTARGLPLELRSRLPHVLAADAAALASPSRPACSPPRYLLAQIKSLEPRQTAAPAAERHEIPAIPV